MKETVTELRVRGGGEGRECSEVTEEEDKGFRERERSEGESHRVQG